MDARPFSSRQLRHLREGESLWLERERLLRAEADLSGGMTWKTVRGREYLIRFWSDPLTGAKRSKSLGVRSAATEDHRAAFLQSRLAHRDAGAAAETSLKSWGERAEELSLPRLSRTASDILCQVHAAGLPDVRLLDRGARVPQSVSLEVELSQVPVLDPFGAGGRPLTLLVPDGMDDDVADAVMRSHRGLERKGPAILDPDRAELVAMVVRRSHVAGWATSVAGAEQGDAVLYALGLPAASAVVPGADGLPVRAGAVDPLATVFMACVCAANADTRSGRLEEYATGLFDVLLELEHPGLDQAVVSSFPELAAIMDRGGNDGLRI